MALVHWARWKTRESRENLVPFHISFFGESDDEFARRVIVFPGEVTLGQGNRKSTGCMLFIFQ